jgi:hypothetical protein
MLWVIQDTKREGHLLAEAVRRAGHPLAVVQLVPFSHDLIPEPEAHDGRAIAFGSTSMIQAAASRGWKPGVYWDPSTFTFDAWRFGYGAHLLNYDAQVSRLGDAVLERPAFVRPCDDLKQFTGHIMYPEDFDGWRAMIELASSHGPCAVTADTLISIAPPQEILQEWRFFVVGGRVVAGSLYRHEGELLSARTEPDHAAWRFAQYMAEEWQPAHAFVLDAAETELPYGGGRRRSVLEVNTLNVSRLYDADPDAIVAALAADPGV